MVLPVTLVVTPMEIGKPLYLEQKISKIDEIRTVKPKADSIQSDGIHPTKEGTEDTIRQLNDAFDKEIVIPEATPEDITTSAQYSKVQEIFKVGCRACTTIEFCHYLSKVKRYQC